MKVTCRVNGRIGDQLFQIANVLGYAQKYKIEPVFVKSMGFHYGGENSYFDTLFRGLVFVSPPRRVIEYKETKTYAEIPEPHQLVSSSDDVLLCFVGHFQDARYSHGIDLLPFLMWPNECKLRWSTFLKHAFQSCKDETTAGVHIRRGDLPAVYYTRSAEKINIKNAVILSDDPRWCRSQAWIRDLGVVVPDTVDEVTGLYFLAQCAAGVVVASGTYSWWGATLSGSKLVCCPNNNDIGGGSEWIQISCAAPAAADDIAKEEEEAEEVKVCKRWLDVRKARTLFSCGDDAAKDGKYTRRGKYLERLLKKSKFEDVTWCKGIMDRSRCVLSMIAALDVFSTQDEWRPILWLEDDVDFCAEDLATANWQVEYPSDADAIYVGMSQGTLVAHAPYSAGDPLAAQVEDYKDLRRIWNMLGTHAILILTRRFASLLQRCFLEDTVRKWAWDVSLGWSLASYQVFALRTPMFYQAYDVGTRRATMRNLETATVSKDKQKQFDADPRTLCQMPPLANYRAHAPLRISSSSSSFCTSSLAVQMNAPLSSSVDWLVVVVAWGAEELQQIAWTASEDAVRFILVTDCPDQFVNENGWTVAIADQPASSSSQKRGHDADAVVVAAVLSLMDLDTVQQVVVVRGDLPQIKLSKLDPFNGVVCTGAIQEMPRKWSRVTRRGLHCHISPRSSSVNVPDGLFWYGDARQVLLYCKAAADALVGDDDIMDDCNRPGASQCLASAATECEIRAPADFGLFSCVSKPQRWELQTTKTDTEYKYIPLRCIGGWQVVAQGSVKASNDVHISLELDDTNDPVRYEFVVGGWGNTKSAIRLGDRVVQETKFTLESENSFKILKTDAGFELWMNDKKALWMDVKNYEVSAVGAHTGWGSAGAWRFDEMD